MLLTEGDIGNVVAAAVGTREMPAFLKKFTEQGGLIYGIGPAISEYWTAWEMYDAIATLSEEDKATARRALSNTAKAYELFRKNVNKHLATDGMYILARSNEFIQFKGTDQLKVKIEGRKSTPAPQKSLSMSITTESDQRREFFDRFADSGYAIDKTSYDAVKRGIDKDW
jgi:outer membrane PBP1 activator LpoA protein